MNTFEPTVCFILWHWMNMGRTNLQRIRLAQSLKSSPEIACCLVVRTFENDLGGIRFLFTRIRLLFGVAMCLYLYISVFTVLPVIVLSLISWFWWNWSAMSGLHSWGGDVVAVRIVRFNEIWCDLFRCRSGMFCQKVHTIHFGLPLFATIILKLKLTIVQAHMFVLLSRICIIYRLAQIPYLSQDLASCPITEHTVFWNRLNWFRFLFSID